MTCLFFPEWSMKRLHVTKHNFWYWYSWMETLCAAYMMSIQNALHT